MASQQISSIIRRAVVEIGIFSAATNVLVLVTPLYLLQVYDRVLVASSLETLVYISLMALAGLGVLGVIEVVRGQYASRAAARIDAAFGADLLLSAMEAPRAAAGDVQPLRDLATVRAFLSSRTLFFLFDLPFAPLFIVLLWFVHPLLFWLTVVGAALMVGAAALNQMATGRSGRAAGDTLAATMGQAQSFARGFETVRALGMTGAAVELWGRNFADALGAADRVNWLNAVFGGISRTIRMSLQIAILGVGAWLVLKGEMTAGMIFASSIISGRALQPLDQLIGAWRQVVDAGRAWRRIRALPRLAAPVAGGHIALPAPSGALHVDDVTYLPPGAEPGAPPIIKRVSFKVEPGETVAVVGPSQAGKSTLARLIVGAIAPLSGTVRLDGADLRSWDPDDLGRHLGYLPQEVELFPGSIGQNVARFDVDADDEQIVLAAQRAQAHEMILRQKAGYATPIGPGGVRLSGGERQRVGLARAFYRDPRLLVLDEPNAHLDLQGEQALEKAMLDAKARGSTVLVVTHRPSIAARCDRVLLLRDGQIDLYGPAREILQRLAQGQVQPTASQPAASQPAPEPANPVRMKAN
ncbi:MAG: type I secretion system permease/ATPase [Rhizobiaceae bacterium]|nr:type I secretion system permease/ATPase [Rhizobiaceae bacterium]